MSGKDDLLACPFCGSQVALSVLEDDPGEIISAWVHCSCGVEIHERRTEAEAVMHWNTRAVPAQASPEPSPKCLCCEEVDVSHDGDECKFCRTTYSVSSTGLPAPAQTAALPPEWICALALPEGGYLCGWMFDTAEEGRKKLKAALASHAIPPTDGAGK